MVFAFDPIIDDVAICSIGDVDRMFRTRAAALIAAKCVLTANADLMAQTVYGFDPTEF